MILSYIYNILKFKKWEVFFFVTTFIALKWSKIITFKPDINRLTELEKCPVCYGTSACSYIDKVDITPYDFYSAFSYFLGIKNVFTGTHDGYEVILKKLAHDSELSEFDRTLCETDKFSSICAKDFSKIDNINFRELIEQEVTLDFTKDNFSHLRVCPSVERLDNLLQHIYLNNKNVDPEIVDISIWMLTVLNPEPLLLQILSKVIWPVPKYFGACGRIVIEEYVGLPLTAYYNESWLHRAKIVHSLLDAAYKFTYGSDEFGFYLTDISADNIAIDSDYNAKFVDLENVIIVDKNFVPKEEPTKWNQLQENTESFNCTDCLAFDSAEICSHKISDHNYYAICKTLLALNIHNNVLPGGLLHDIPATVKKKYPNIQYLIEQCVIPQVPFTRISAGMELKQLLGIIIQFQEQE
ncbi:divergent protein kinase domain 2A [Calliopsis andreniformis]|uniref:divergent protein kinase domain 2A n=1 Tax=Calliopsis andreniformis TaxID=337506 RepID=UPI003FCE3E72